MGKLVAGQPSQFGDGLAQEDWRIERVVKKFGGCNAQKFTNSKKLDMDGRAFRFSIRLI